ncbi:MAG: PEGA domain-containing protein, partial [Candidatus Eisenbacteria bacterium]|nr:PEGA domain-containing protein [Candidatus Eisenbacteria bacterium]
MNTHSRAGLLGVISGLLILSGRPVQAAGVADPARLAAEIRTLLEERLPGRHPTIALAPIRNPSGAPVDAGALSAELEGELARSQHLQLLAPDLMAQAPLIQDTPSQAVDWFAPAHRRHLGTELGLQALIGVELTGSSELHPRLRGSHLFTELFVTATDPGDGTLLLAVPLTVWDDAGLAAWLGEDPPEDGLSRDQDFAQQLAAFAGAQAVRAQPDSQAVVAVLPFSAFFAHDIVWTPLERAIAAELAQSRGLRMLDPKVRPPGAGDAQAYVPRVETEAQLEALAEFYPVDFVISGEILAATSDSLACRVAIGTHPGGTDVSRKEIAARAAPSEQRIKHLLLHTGPTLFATDPPGAEVFIDGQHIGRSPASLQLEPGSHKVRLLLAGYPEDTLTIESHYHQAGLVHTRLSLGKQPIDIHSSPTGAA